MINENDIQELLSVLKCLEVTLDRREIIIWNWNRGIDSHIPRHLPADKMAIYGFKIENEYLKIGATAADDRFWQQHYCPRGANSCLARSILFSHDLSVQVGTVSIREWIRINTDRWNILLPKSLGNKIRDFIEAYFILKFNPRFNW